MEDIEKCKRCDLWKFANNKVLPEIHGNEIMFIGEAPGYWEDLKAKPFVGRAGKLLRNLMKEYKIEDYIITNVVKCRPPNNRVPTDEEQEKCGIYLLREIEKFKPKIIVCLGATSSSFIAKKFGLNFKSITKDCCKVHKVSNLFGNFKIIFCVHPAAALRREEWKDKLKECFEQITLLRQ